MQGAKLARAWAGSGPQAGSQMSWSMPLRMPQNLSMCAAIAGCPLTCARAGTLASRFHVQCSF